MTVETMDLRTAPKRAVRRVDCAVLAMVPPRVVLMVQTMVSQKAEPKDLRRVALKVVHMVAQSATLKAGMRTEIEQSMVIQIPSSPRQWVAMRLQEQMQQSLTML